MDKFYITNAIPYVNADPHIGFAMELIQSDVLARYHRLVGDETYLLNGADENALKNVQAADKAGVGVREFVDEHTERFIELSKKLDISNNDFIKTTEKRHIEGAQKLWQTCDDNGDIYKKKYKGLYCVGCEEFKTKKELVDGLCPEHRIEPEEVEEENYFFKLSKYEKELLSLIESNQVEITPVTRKNEIVEFIKSGLEDFSISRSHERAKGWGVTVPGDDTQKMYVWFDALANYITALDYANDGELFDKYWKSNKNRSHMIGKGIIRFHAIYWPAMLLSAKLPLPTKIYVHGYITVEGEKMSKSLGNVVDPFDVIKKYGSDVVRYFLLREIPSDGDGDFSIKKLEERYNGELANGLGNLIQRVATLIENNLEGELIYNSQLTTHNSQQNQQQYKEAINNFRLHEAIGEIWKLIGEADKYVDEQKPWVQVKADPDEFLKSMTTLVAMIHNIAWLLQPFMPDTARKIFETFGDNGEKEILDKHHFRIKKGKPLFPRLN